MQQSQRMTEIIQKMPMKQWKKVISGEQKSLVKHAEKRRDNRIHLSAERA